MDSWAWVFMPISFVVGLGAGLLAGIALYAHMYGHFMFKQEEKANLRVARALVDERRKRLDKHQVIEKMRGVYGDDFSKRHEEVISEEVEKILGAGPGSKGDDNGK